MKPIDSADVVIVGGGVIGCSIAYHLAQLDITDVVLVERESIASGATGVAPGGIRQQFEGEADCLLARRSVRFWEQINDRLEPDHPFHFDRLGYVFLADSPTRLGRFRRNVEMQNRLGIPSRVLDPADIHELLPRVNCESVVGGTFCAEDGFLEDCQGVARQFSSRARERGARVVYDEAVALRFVGGRWHVRTRRGMLEGTHVILAAGVDSVPLAAGVGVDLPIVGQRRRLAFSVPVEPLVLPPLLVAPERAFAGKQMTEGVFYLGWLDEGEEHDDHVFVERALQAGATLLPMLADVPIRSVVTGTYDTTPDHRPILGPVPDVDGLWLAAGFSGHGFMIAPAVGEGVACRIAEQETDLPLDAFSLARFSHVTRAEGLTI